MIPAGTTVDNFNIIPAAAAASKASRRRSEYCSSADKISIAVSVTSLWCLFRARNLAVVLNKNYKRRRRTDVRMRKTNGCNNASRRSVTIHADTVRAFLLFGGCIVTKQRIFPSLFRGEKLMKRHPAVTQRCVMYRCIIKATPSACTLM